ncbi:hypothetical protein C0991_003714, partial [Blastosporella zonata]
ATQCQLWTPASQLHSTNTHPNHHEVHSLHHRPLYSLCSRRRRTYPQPRSRRGSFHSFHSIL